MLIFVGLGIKGQDSLTLEGLQQLKKADRIYIELYTSPLPQLNMDSLRNLAGKEVTLLSRDELEDGEEVLKEAQTKEVVLLVPGDPMVATTHIALRLRAEERGIKTKIVHSSSIQTAAVGLTGLQSYKFGRSATIPLHDIKSVHPYRVLKENKEAGLHTLLLLDYRAEEKEYLTVNEGIRVLLRTEEDLGEGVFTPETLAIGIARAGAEATVRGDEALRLLEEDFGPPPHVLVVPGKLHFMEAKALKILAKVPDHVLRKLEG